jgi:signal transduction histidine kinase
MVQRNLDAVAGAISGALQPLIARLQRVGLPIGGAAATGAGTSAAGPSDDGQWRTAERSGAAIGAFAAGVAHEINNPLASILATAQLALAQRDDPSARESYERALSTIIVETKRCGRILESVLQFAQERTERWPCDLNFVALRARDLIRQDADLRDVTIELRLQQALATVCVDPVAVEQVVVSLLRNACRNGSGRAVTIATYRDGAHVVLVVRDEGPGIPGGCRVHVFDPAQRARLGLGLNDVRDTVIEQGGSITLDPDRAHGTTVRIAFPTFRSDAALAI